MTTWKSDSRDLGDETGGSPGTKSGGFPPGWTRGWRLFFLVAAVIYSGVVLYWGRYDLERVHFEYHRAVVRSGGDYALAAARTEVAAGCREAIGQGGGPLFDDCLRSGAPLINLRAAVLDRQLQQEKDRAFRKLLIFYSLVILALILLPLAFFYVVLRTLFFIINNIRYDRERTD